MTSEFKVNRLKVIACPVFKPELDVLAAEARPRIEFRYLDMGLHDQPAKTLQNALQQAIDQTPADGCDAIAVAYGLCNRGLVGLQARSLPVAIPRAHDCIGMLLGGTQCYLAQLETQPGTYFQSPGWLANSLGLGQVRQQNLPFMPGVSLDRAELAARYGEDNADFLLEQLGSLARHYEQLAYIDTPVPGSKQWEEQAREIAAKRGWTFQRLRGKLDWLSRLLNAEWNEEEFLLLQPGEQVVLRHDQRLIEGRRP